MITRLEISGFKSFHNFSMDFTPLTVIAGLNASGKSNIFDALMLIARLAETDNLKKAFSYQRGEFTELFTQYPQGDYAKEIHFRVEMLVKNHIKDDWGGEKQLKYTRLQYELKLRRYTNDSDIEDVKVIYERLVSIRHEKDTWIRIIPRAQIEFWRPKVKTGKRGQPYINTIVEDNLSIIELFQDGTSGRKRRFPLKNASRTVLSSIDTIDFPHVLAAKQEMRSWKFLQLNPEDLRTPSNKANAQDSISSTGKNLAAALYRITKQNPKALTYISRNLHKFIPNFVKVEVHDDRENKQFIIKLIDKDGKIYSSRVLSEGTLRILALCILEQDEAHTALLCFEEPENGIHVHRIAAMAQLLERLSNDFSIEDLPLRQVIVNTHSHVLVNYYYQKIKPSLSLWYANIKTKIVNIEDKRFNLPVSNIQPVALRWENNIFSSSDYTEADQKITLALVQKYLQNPEGQTY